MPYFLWYLFEIEKPQRKHHKNKAQRNKWFSDLTGHSACKTALNLPSRIRWATLSVAKCHWGDSAECGIHIHVHISSPHLLTAAYSLLMPLTAAYVAATTPPTAGEKQQQQHPLLRQNKMQKQMRSEGRLSWDWDWDWDWVRDWSQRPQACSDNSNKGKDSAPKNAAAKQTTRLGSEFVSSPVWNPSRAGSKIVQREDVAPAVAVALLRCCCCYCCCCWCCCICICGARESRKTAASASRRALCILSWKKTGNALFKICKYYKPKPLEWTAFKIISKSRRQFKVIPKLNFK